MARRTKKYLVKSNAHKSYIKKRERQSTVGHKRKYAWTSNRGRVYMFENYERARSVARRYSGRVIKL